MTFLLFFTVSRVFNPLLPKIEVVTTDIIVLVQYEFQVDQTAYCDVQLALLSCFATLLTMFRLLPWKRIILFTTLRLFMLIEIR